MALLVVGTLVIAGAALVRSRIQHPAGTAAPRSAAGPRRGGVLRLGVVGVGSLDPAQARTGDQQLIADQLFDTLARIDPAGRPEPELAASWTVSADQRQWDFTLRDGASFSDGTPVTALDVKYSLERVARRASGSPATELLQPVQGFAAFASGTAPDLSGVQATASNQLHVSLDTPLSVLPSVLANPAFGVVLQRSVEGGAASTTTTLPISGAVPGVAAAGPPVAFPERPVTSGPFRLVGRRRDRLILRRSPGRSTRLNGIDAFFYADAAAAYDAFTRSALDVSPVPAERVESAGQRYGTRAFVPYVAELFYGFNLADPALADVRLRRAIVRAVDRRAIITAIYGGTVLPATGPVVAGVPGHQDDPCGGDCGYDPAAARALVAEVYPDGNVPPLAIDYDEDTTQEAVAKAMQANLFAAGIPTTLRAKPFADYQRFVVSGQQQIFRLGWIGPYVSADAFLTPLFRSTASSNLTGFRSEEVDAMLAAAEAEPNEAIRVARFQQAERRIMADVPVLPLAQFELHVVTSARVRALVPVPSGTFDGAKVWLVPSGGS